MSVQVEVVSQELNDGASLEIPVKFSRWSLFLHILARFQVLIKSLLNLLVKHQRIFVFIRAFI